MGAITIEQGDAIFWLGRYTERVYTTMDYFAQSFDQMIDYDTEDYTRFCASLDIPNIYTDGHDFIRRYCFDLANPDSIASNLKRGYDNAVVIRELLGSPALSYIQLAVYAMNRAACSDAPMIELQKVKDNIVAFWGMADDNIGVRDLRDILKIGRRVERLDLYARLHLDGELVKRAAERLTGRLIHSHIRYSKAGLNNIYILVNAPEIDYNSLLKETESLIER